MSILQAIAANNPHLFGQQVQQNVVPMQPVFNIPQPPMPQQPQQQQQGGQGPDIGTLMKIASMFGGA